MKKKKLKLSNDGQLNLFFVGIGSAFTRKMFQTNLLLIKGPDHILIDCGTKCPQALYELGLEITDIENYLITHSHADHIGGLEEASLMGKYSAKKKPSMVITENYQHILWNMSLRGGCAFNEEKKGYVLDFGDFWHIRRPNWQPNYPRETYEIQIGSINIKMFRTMHIPDNSRTWETSFWSCGLIIDDRVMFTGDTRYDEDLVKSFDSIFKLEMIFHDCQFFTGGVHASLEELNELPPGIKERMILTHYGDNWENYTKRVENYGFRCLGQQHVFYQFD